MKDRQVLYVTMAIYEHKEWQKIVTTPTLTCREKENLAWMKEKVRVYLSGQDYEGYVVRQNRDWFMPKMYYIAVMDCDDEIHDALGDSIEHRLDITMTLLADNAHFSYDKQGEH